MCALTMPRCCPFPVKAPFLFTERPTHRDWIYGYGSEQQIIRGVKVMNDGREKWWDVASKPDDLISIPHITDWKKVSDTHRAERDKLNEILPTFDLHATQHDAL